MPAPTPDPDGIRIVEAGAERIDEVEPMFRALHEHHRTLDPSIPGVEMRVSDESWPRRRARYVEWLTEPGSFLLLAESLGAPVGYAMARQRQGSEGWATEERCGELESLVVLPSHRGRGIGSALLDAVLDRFRREGIADLYVEVLTTNDDARKMYERRGLRPWVVTMLGRIQGE